MCEVTAKETKKWQRDTASMRRQLFKKKQDSDASWKSEERRKPLRGGKIGRSHD